MKKISFHGAAGTVTGSAFIVTRNDEHPIMIDMGMFQGPKHIADLNYEPLQFDPAGLEGLLLTHAHLDHCGRLPLLTQRGFNKKIYMTQPTADLLELTLLDAAHIAAHNAENDAGRPPLFDEHDVERTLSLVEIVEYDKAFTLGPYVVLYKDAGHIIGSASIQILDEHNQDAVGTIIFSGDIGNFPQDLVQPTEFFDAADVVVMESTYGGKVHTHENPSSILQEEINIVEKEDAVLLIPAFSIERTQELLHRLDHLKQQGTISEQTPIFLDSPMAIKATQIYKKYRHLFNSELSRHISKDDPFDFPGLHLIEGADESMKIHNTPGGKVIIAGSGMMTGGRILHHALMYLPHKNTRLLIVGYQGEGTLGRAIADGAQEVEIFGQTITMNAQVRVVTSMSAHADEPKLLAWLQKIKGVKKVFLIHGDDQPRLALKEKITTLGIDKVAMPRMHEQLEVTV